MTLVDVHDPSDACILDIAAGGTYTCSDTFGDCDVTVTVTADLTAGSSVDTYAIRVPYAWPLE